MVESERMTPNVGSGGPFAQEIAESHISGAVNYGCSTAACKTSTAETAIFILQPRGFARVVGAAAAGSSGQVCLG
jgi:hypothetical protein